MFPELLRCVRCCSPKTRKTNAISTVTYLFCLLNSPRSVPARHSRRHAVVRAAAAPSPATTPSAPPHASSLPGVPTAAPCPCYPPHRRTLATSPRARTPPSPSLGIGTAARAVRPDYRTLVLPRLFVDPLMWLGRRLPQRPHARLRDAAGVEPFLRAALIEGGSK